MRRLGQGDDEEDDEEDDEDDEDDDDDDEPSKSLHSLTISSDGVSDEN